MLLPAPAPAAGRPPGPGHQHTRRTITALFYLHCSSHSRISWLIVGCIADSAAPCGVQAALSAVGVAAAPPPHPCAFRGLVPRAPVVTCCSGLALSGSVLRPAALSKVLCPWHPRTLHTKWKSFGRPLLTYELFKDGTACACLLCDPCVPTRAEQ